jgi:hypothetical protein
MPGSGTGHAYDRAIALKVNAVVNNLRIETAGDPADGCLPRISDVAMMVQGT